MKRVLRILAPLAALAAATALGACVGPDDGSTMPFTRAALESEALPTCSADDLAVADEFVPLVDDPDLVVGLMMGQPLCSCESLPAELDPTSLVPRLLKPAGQSSSNNPPVLTPAGFVAGTGVIQDPTPQPAKPGQPDSSSLAPAPPVPVTNSDKN